MISFSSFPPTVAATTYKRICRHTHWHFSSGLRKWGEFFFKTHFLLLGPHLINGTLSHLDLKLNPSLPTVSSSACKHLQATPIIWKKKIFLDSICPLTSISPSNVAQPLVSHTISPAKLSPQKQYSFTSIHSSIATSSKSSLLLKLPGFQQSSFCVSLLHWIDHYFLINETLPSLDINSTILPWYFS